MQKLNIILVILLFALYSTSVRAANVIKYISNINGLSNNSVNCIFEDSDNLLWVGTWDGLNTYNGKDIKSYRYSKNDKQSISNNIIRQIIEQNQSTIWIATDYGINKWNKQTQEFTRYYLGTEDKVPKQERSYILGLSADKRLFCFVKDEGMFVLNQEVDTFEPLKLYFEDYIKDFKITTNNDIFFLFQDGDILFENIKDLKIGQTIKDLNGIEQSVAPISKFFVLNNKLAFVQEEKISILDEVYHPLTEIYITNSKNVSYIVENSTNLYISFVEGGCIKYDLKLDQLETIEDLASHTSIFTMHSGSQDVLWLGSDGQGVVQLYDYNFPFRTIKAKNPVRAFVETNQDQILVGTKGGGIKYLDKENNLLVDYLDMNSGLISNSVYSLHKNLLGDIFIGTEGEGINILYANSKQVEKLKIPSFLPSFKSVYSIASTHNDSLLWVGTSGYGLFKLELGKSGGKYLVKTAEQYTSSNHLRKLRNDIVYTMTHDPSGDNLWFGTRGGGLNRLNIKTNDIERIEDIDGGGILLSNNDILSIYNDNQTLWVGTSYGLNRLNKTSITHYTDQEGLINNTIHGIIRDAKNNIWISTNQGLSVINTQNEIDNYTMNIGLQNDEFSDGAYYKDKNNILYFGGVSGLNYFDPQKIKKRNFRAEMALSSLKIYDSIQNLSKRIKNNTLELTYDERYITLNIVAKDFVNNENCEYAFRLLPETGEWTKLGNNSSIVFTKLGWGKYTLEVKNTNGDKVWNDNIYRLNIHVGPPWWLSISALLIYSLVLAVILYIAQSVVKNKIRMNRELLIQQIEKQHQQNAHEAKLNFFTNVAHEFFTPLTLIYGPAQHLLDNPRLDNQSKKYLQIIKNNAERMQKLISELMEFRKAKTGFTPLHPEMIDIQLLLNYVSDNYREILLENRIDYKVDAKNLSTLFTNRDALEKIFINLVSNAFKYTPINGYIHINIKQDGANGTLHLKITNSGKGLTEIQMEEIFNKHKIFDSPRVKGAVSTGIGLNLTKSLVEILGGEIAVDSNLNENVQFRLTIPSLHKDTTNIVSEKQEKYPPATAHTQQLLRDRRSRDITILIVEDEKHIRDLLKDILSTSYNVIEAADGKQAMNIIDNNHPDIIISDILMPNLDGMSMINKLKSNPRTRYIPIINISARTSIEDQIEAYEHGADLYITKPFHPKHILSTVQNLIERHSFLKDYYHSSISSITLKDGIEIHKDDEKLIQNIASYIHSNIDNETLDPASIAEYMNISKATLYRQIKEITDSTPSEFIRNIRLEYASTLLITTKLTVSEIMFKCGFTNKSYFYREFGKLYGLTPIKYREEKQS